MLAKAFSHPPFTFICSPRFPSLMNTEIIPVSSGSTYRSSAINSRTNSTFYASNSNSRDTVKWKGPRRRITSFQIVFQVEISERRRFFSIGPSLNRLTWKFPNLCAFRFRASSNHSRCRAFKKISQRKPIRTTRVLRNARVNYAVQHVINDRSYRSPERRRTLTNSRSRCPRKLISFRTSERQEQQILRGMRRPVPFRRSLEMTWRGRTSLFSPLLCPTLERVPGFDEMVAGVIEISCSSPGRYDGVHDGPRTVHHPSSSTVPFASVILSTDIRTRSHVTFVERERAAAVR